MSPRRRGEKQTASQAVRKAASKTGPKLSSKAAFKAAYKPASKGFKARAASKAVCHFLRIPAGEKLQGLIMVIVIADANPKNSVSKFMATFYSTLHAQPWAQPMTIAIPYAIAQTTVTHILTMRCSTWTTTVRTAYPWGMCATACSMKCTTLAVVAASVVRGGVLVRWVYRLHILSMTDTRALRTVVIPACLRNRYPGRLTLRKE